jgi:hypothetical protein
VSRRKWSLSKNTAAEIFLVVLLGVCFFYTFPRWADPNQNSRLDMVVAVVDEHTFRIDNYVKNTVDYAKVGEHYYSDKAPGAAFLGIPIYAGVKWVLDLPWVDRLETRLEANPAFRATLNPEGTGILKEKVQFAAAEVVISFFLSLLPTLVIALLMARLLGKWGMGLPIRIGLPLAYGLLTPVFAYANTFYSHQLSAALCFSVFAWANFAARPFSRKGIFLAGLALAWAVISEYPAALLAGIVGLYILLGLARQKVWQRIGFLVLGSIAPLAGWMAYNTFLFGGPLSLGYSYSEQWTVQHHTGFMSLTAPRLDALWGISFSPFRGLFLLSPILLYALFGFVLWGLSRERVTEFWIVLGGVAATFLFNICSIMWWGGFAVGPRYVLPALPFLVLPIGFVFQRFQGSKVFRWVSLLLCAWSLAATWGLTLAGQSFPSDALHNPLVEVAWPSWVAGNLARNVGTLLGLRGTASLIPLVLFGLLLGLAGWWLYQRGSRPAQPQAQTQFEMEQIQ